MATQGTGSGSASFASVASAGALALTTLCGTAAGQVDHAWALPVSGFWTEAANWNPAQVPLASDHRAMLGFMTAYEVRLPASMQVGIDQLVVSNPLARLVLEYSPTSTATTLTLASPLVNEGEIVIEGGLFSGKGAELVLPENSLLGGSGVIRMTHDLAKLRANPVQRQFTNGPEHEICGAGWIVRVLNQGVVDADLPGEQLLAGTYRNDGIARASNGGILNISTNAAGSGFFEAIGAGSKVKGSLKHDPRIRSEGGGLFEKIELVNPVVEGAVSFGQEVEIDGVLRNDGELFITASQVKFDVSASSLVDAVEGTGEIILTGVGAELRFSTDRYKGTPVYNSIRGSGSIGPYFESFRPIIADTGDQLTVGGVTNHSVIEARNGGHLSIGAPDNRGIIRILKGSTAKIAADQSSDGVIYVDGGAVTLTGLQGGRIQTVNGGSVRCPELVELHGFHSEARIDFESVSYLDGIFVNDGQYTLGTTRPTSLELGKYVNPTVVEGLGRITLYPAKASQVQGRPGEDAMIGAGQTIEGSGSLSWFIHRGVLAPGLDSDPFGSMRINGIRFESTSVIKLDMDHDRIDMIEFLAASATLDGTLALRFLNGYVPEPCSERVVLAGNNLVGSFDSYDLPPVPLGRLAIRSEPGIYTLVYNPADHDGSTFVDTDDFTAFMADFESGNDSADINHSGAVDGEDFADFVAAFEQGC